MRSRAGCTKQNSPHQKEEAEEGRYRPLRVPSSEGPRLALRCDSVLEPLPTTNPCMVRLFASSRIRCPRPWKCGSKWRCQWEPLVEELPQKDGQSTNQLRWPARSGAGLLPAPKGLQKRFRQWTRRSSPLNPAQGLFHLLAGEDVPLGQPFESGQDNDVLDWSQQHAGRDWVHHESQPGIDRGERRLLPRKRQKSGQDGCGVLHWKWNRPSGTAKSGSFPDRLRPRMSWQWPTSGGIGNQGRSKPNCRHLRERWNNT